jgi:gliding motility-associated-like protein
MHKRICRLVFSILTVFIINSAYSQQQDVEFHLNAHLLNGQKILKVKRDFHDIYLWVLGQNNTIYRVNSLTLAIDDYSSKFNAYKSFQFVDIIGHSADTVFVATNSSNVIECANGTFRVIGSSDGIPGIVNSIGVDLGWNMDSSTSRGEMIIGTNKGVRTFNVQTQTLGFLPDTGVYATNSKIANSRIFESTYRSETYKDSTGGDASGWANSATHYMPVIYNTSNIYTYTGPLVCSYIWEGNNIFGNNVNTVFALNNGVLFYDNGYWADYFWGSEKGMFQTEAANSWNNITADVWSQYLNGIKVNKITDIMGLTGFNNNYDSGLIKENLLIGTDTGFYFSSSIYVPGGLYPGKFALFHDDELGSTVINDICVNAVPDFQPICENGVWLAANDGLYLLKPDYAKYFNNQQQKLISFSNQPDTLSQMQVCALSPLSANVNSPYANIQWYKDGAELPGQSKDTLVITATGDYNAVIYDPCEAIHIESNHLKVSVIAGPVFTFNYPQKLQYCDSTQTTLKVTYSPSYYYQWYTNGVLNGNTTSSCIVTKTGKYKVEVSACTNSWVPSKEVEVDLINLPVPQISADKSLYCAEDTAALTVNVPADPAYTINWYRNGNLLANDNNLTTIKDINAGSYTVVINSNIANCTQTSAPFQLAFTPSPMFTFNYPNVLQYCTGTPLTLNVVGSPNYQFRWYKDGILTGDVTAALFVTQPGKYKVEVSACQNSWVPSKEIQVNFITLPIPVITTDKPAYCIGDNATLAISAPVDPDYTINWYKDNVLLTADANQNSITTNIAGNYTVSIVNNTVNTDGTTCSQTSAVSSIAFNPPPTVSIEKIVNTTICEGQTIGLLAHYKGGTVKWSTGETTDQISVTTPGNYTATVTSAAGCLADTSITVAFLPNPVFSVNDTSVCAYKKQVITLSAPPGFAQYAWNGTPGGQTYQVSQPQTVSLTVTDVNGCQVSQQIKVADQCPNVYIPNAFTPNGDGINDTWVIEGLDNDPTVSVKVFTRYGNLIFNSQGYGTPWNGEYNAKKLPAAVYYYIVTVKNGTQKFSGSVTIIY